MNTIMSLTGQYRFLSNFYPCPISYRGIIYPSVEHAYQAAKASDEQEIQRIYISRLTTAAEAKRAGRKISIRTDWDQIKLRVMGELVRIKFRDNPLRDMIRNTGTSQIVEGNHWGDTFWGVCRGKGENHLGKILMKIRDEIVANSLG